MRISGICGRCGKYYKGENCQNPHTRHSTGEKAPYLGGKIYWTEDQHGTLTGLEGKEIHGKREYDDFSKRAREERGLVHQEEAKDRVKNSWQEKDAKMERHLETALVQSIKRITGR